MVKTSYYAVLMNFNKGETAVHGCHCPADMAVCTCNVLARPWVGVFVPLALRLRYYYYIIIIIIIIITIIMIIIIFIIIMIITTCI